MINNNVLIIAEAGVNHNGELSLAFELVDKAAESGADYIKFQTFKADNLATKDVKKAQYQLTSGSVYETQYQMLKRLELNNEMHQKLIHRCSEKKIGFLSSGFDIKSIDYLIELNVPIIKVPSGEITNLPYLRHIGRLGKEILISTGMSTISEIESAINILIHSGSKKESITVLHCNSDYPTPMNDVNLLAMKSMSDIFGVKVGYSDHTNGIEVPIAAVALGASVIEKHFTIDKNLVGPDHQASLEPHELCFMVSPIRNIEKALGSDFKQPSKSEEKNKMVVRKSIVASKPIKMGELFSEKNLTVKRPGNGISPMLWDEVLGTKSNQNYQKDELIFL